MSLGEMAVYAYVIRPNTKRASDTAKDQSREVTSTTRSDSSTHLSASLSGGRLSCPIVSLFRTSSSRELFSLNTGTQVRLIQCSARLFVDNSLLDKGTAHTAAYLTILMVLCGGIVSCSTTALRTKLTAQNFFGARWFGESEVGSTRGREVTFEH